MARTQLQMRIESSVRTGQTYPQGTYFIDTKGYAERPFIDSDDPLYMILSDEDVKSGRTYEEIKPAVQARLAQMEYGNELLDILSKHYASQSTIISRFIGRVKLAKINLRNYLLKRRAVNRVIKQKGGLKWVDCAEIRQRIMDCVFSSKLLNNIERLAWQEQ